MRLLKTILWPMALVGAIALVPWEAIAAQQPNLRPDAQTPRVVVIAAFDDSTPELSLAIAAAAQERFAQLVSPHRLWLVSKKDIDNSLVTESTPKVMLPEDYRGLAKLVRGTGTVVLTARGRRDSLDVIGWIVLNGKQPIDTVHFQAPSPGAAVDSLVAKLLADPRFRRGAT